MNRLFQTEGIVIRNIKLNEADKIVIIFSRNYGKIRAIAKGIRKTRSQFGSSLENLTRVKLLVYKGKNLYTISQTEIVKSFFLNSKDLNRYALAIQCAEIIDRITEEEDPNEQIYNIFTDMLEFLNDEKNITLLTEAFKWKLTNILGFQPELKKCINCNQSVKNSDYHTFDIKKGGIVCNACCGSKNCYQIKISNYCLKLLKRIIVADLAMIHNKKVIECELCQLSKITEKYMSYYFDINNKSQEFVNKLESFKK